MVACDSRPLFTKARTATWLVCKGNEAVHRRRRPDRRTERNTFPPNGTERKPNLLHPTPHPKPTPQLFFNLTTHPPFPLPIPNPRKITWRQTAYTSRHIWGGPGGRRATRTAQGDYPLVLSQRRLPRARGTAERA
eukprot:3995015-Prymnesium_polylepis.1